MNQLDNIEKAEIISKTDLPQEAKTIGVMSALFGVDNESIIHSMINAMTNKQTSENEGKFPKRRLAKGYDDNEKAIVSMLTENSGAHMLDSGGIYGRHWEKNRFIKDFRDIPKLRITTDEWNKQKQFEIHLNLFQFLNEKLEIDKALTTKFYRFCNRKANKDESYMGCIELFIEELGSEITLSDNSYNHDNLLDQDFQFHGFEYNDQLYAVIQTHNGCDIRGGYSTPKIFKVCDSEIGYLFDFTHVTASCECGWMDSDNGGYRWHGDLENKENEYKFPKQWNVSTRKNAIFCKDCKKVVNFS